MSQRHAEPASTPLRNGSHACHDSGHEPAMTVMVPDRCPHPLEEVVQLLQVDPLAPPHKLHALLQERLVRLQAGRQERELHRVSALGGEEWSCTRAKDATY